MINKTNSSRFINQLKSLGPGLLWAGAAIGVSHLVQSTRAGANYGFALLWALLLANINYKVVTGNTMPKQFQPKKYLRILSWVGIIFLSGFSLLFITWRFGEGIIF